LQYAQPQTGKPVFHGGSFSSTTLTKNNLSNSDNIITLKSYTLYAYKIFISYSSKNSTSMTIFSVATIFVLSKFNGLSTFYESNLMMVSSVDA
jgi:hypothetical protein